MQHYQVLIVGGGTAGIMAGSRLLKLRKDLKVGIIEPSDMHYYQPAWTLVGANTYKFENTGRRMADVMPKRAEWIKARAMSFDPENNLVRTDNGVPLGYDMLIVCPGLVMAPHLVDGLAEVMDKGVVCSNYTNPKHTWEVLKNFKGGTALFTQPTTPIKCGGAPQKIMYLADEHFRKTGVRDQTTIVFANPTESMFGVPEIRKTLDEVVDRKDIYVRFGNELVAVDGKEQIAWYKLTDSAREHNAKEIELVQDGDRVGIRYDMLHLAPPQAPPKFIADSPLASSSGWLDVDNFTMQHNAYPNVFGLGDVTDVPTSKTGAAVRKQVPVVVANILQMLDTHQLANKKYTGYTSCPLVTGYGKMTLAEFDYDKKFTPDPKLKRLLINDSSKEHWRLWMMKKYILPHLYWNRMLKGVEV